MASSRRNDPALHRLARRKHWVLGWDELLSIGLTGPVIRHRARTGGLRRLGVGVFAVPNTDLTQEGLWRAAVLRSGAGAVLTHTSAAALWEIRRTEQGVIHVTVPTAAGRSARGVRVHRSAGIREDETTIRRDIPVTTLSRTLVDLAAILEPRQLQATLRQAGRTHRLDLRRLAADLLPRRSAPSHARLLNTLAQWVPGIELTESELEARFFELVHRARLPRPILQRKFGRGRLDFVFPDQRTVVEVDGWESHRDQIAFQEDRRRDRKLQAAGYAALRFTWAEVVGDPAAVARELRDFCTKRGRVA